MDATILAGEHRGNDEPQAAAYPTGYIPVVANGRTCPISGLGHAKLYSLLLRGEASKYVRTVSLREPGAKRGKLLFHSGDMLRWLDGLAIKQAQARAAERRPQ